MGQTLPLLPDDALRRRTLHTDSFNPTTDSELLIRQAFAENPRKGYELLFRRYYRPLCSHAVRLIYAREAAEDLVSEVFLNFWKTGAYQQITISYRAYLFRAVRNRASNYLRDQVKGEFSMDAQNQPFDDVPTVEDPHQLLQVTELLHRIQETVGGLPTQCQRVFVLSRFEGKKAAEIADEMNISVKTVETHLTKALSVLKKVLQQGLLMSLWFFVS
ncbi:RNA polymerase sigma-70 factor [Larkinella harenae]